MIRSHIRPCLDRINSIPPAARSEIRGYRLLFIAASFVLIRPS